MKRASGGALQKRLATNVAATVKHGQRQRAEPAPAAEQNQRGGAQLQHDHGDRHAARPAMRPKCSISATAPGNVEQLDEAALDIGAAEQQ